MHCENPQESIFHGNTFLGCSVKLLSFQNNNRTAPDMWRNIIQVLIALESYPKKQVNPIARKITFFVSLPEEHFLVLIDLGKKEPLNIMYAEIILGLCLFNP